MAFHSTTCLLALIVFRLASAADTTSCASGSYSSTGSTPCELVSFSSLPVIRRYSPILRYRSVRLAPGKIVRSGLASYHPPSTYTPWLSIRIRLTLVSGCSIRVVRRGAWCKFPGAVCARVLQYRTSGRMHGLPCRLPL